MLGLTVISTARLNNLLATEKHFDGTLAHWRAHGQLRDPKTGRLIPKDKGAI